VHEWLADFWSPRLDRSRPLWEMTLVDGLQGGGWMLATKTHHAMLDGVGSIDIGHILLDAEPKPAPRIPAKPRRANETDRSAPHLPGWLPPAIAARLARATIDSALHPRRLVHAAEAAVAMSEVLWQDEIMAARHSTLNVPIGTTRRFASVTFELAEVKEIKRALGGTVNDVVLAVATGALRGLLAHRGEELDRPLRAMSRSTFAARITKALATQ
jgi:diacylglycerol O-acyltransferase / wax synthase